MYERDIQRLEALQQHSTDAINALNYVFQDYQAVPEEDFDESTRAGSARARALRRRALREQQRERNRERNRDRHAMRRVSARGLKYQRLKSGWTWNKVLSWHNFNWAAALDYWDECRRIEREHPGHKYWEPSSTATGMTASLSGGDGVMQ